MMSVVNGTSSTSHVGPAPSSASLATARLASNASTTASAATTQNDSSEQRSNARARSRRPKSRNSSSNFATALSATAPSFTPSSVTLDQKRKATAATAAARKPPRKSSPQSTKARSNGASAPTTTPTAATAATAVDPNADLCLLCADPIEFYAVGACNHTGMCSKCFYRLRIILRDTSCPMCKTPLERVVVSRTLQLYEEFPFWGDALGPNAIADDAADMLFVDCKAHYDALCGLQAFKCKAPNCREAPKASLAALKDHMRVSHGTEFCDLCLEHEHFFLQEHAVFTKASIKAHNILGRNGTSRTQAAAMKLAGGGAKHKDFHPMCQFCRKRFYGAAELFAHLERDHYNCHVCKVEHEYFRNYASLETHFRREHHLCEDATCLSNRFVVFPNDIEYQAHMTSVHGATNRLLFNFQVARGGENPIRGRRAPPAASSSIDDAPEFWNYDAVDDAPATRLESAFPALPPPSTPAAASTIIPPSAARLQTLAARSSSAPSPLSSTSGPPRGQVVRNQRVASALGLARPAAAVGTTAAFEDEMKTPHYPDALVEWGKHNAGYLTVVERRLERIVNDPKTHSVSLRVMPSDERKLMHELASIYDVPSESFGEDPNRRLSFFKKAGARIPFVLLSSFIRGKAQQKSAAARLSFLPLRRPGGALSGSNGSAAAAAAAAPKPTAPARPVVRGWEKIELKRAPIVRDAWSDDEDEEDEDAINADEQANADVDAVVATAQAAMRDDSTSSDVVDDDDDNVVEEKAAAVQPSSDDDQSVVSTLGDAFVLTYIEDET